MNMVKEVLSSSIYEERFLYFGDMIDDVEQTGIERKGIIDIQLDKMKKEDLVKKVNEV